MNEQAGSPASSQQKIHALIAEFHRRQEQGPPTTPEEFVAEHSEHSRELGNYFATMRAIDTVAPSERTIDAVETSSGAIDQTIDQTSTASDAARSPSIGSQNSAPLARIGAEANAESLPVEFGRYRILSELGKGAMGAVYLAQDTQLDRKVALKIPQFGGAVSSSMLERFYREARSAGNLRHNGICPIYDVGEIDDQHYISMAFIEGRTLRDYVRSSRRQSNRQVARVIRKIALAMATAHKQDVVHRDLKPANVMIDTNGEPVVMDFGLARRAVENEEKLTHTGTVLGTPAYMSPEQVEGDLDKIGPASDVYSLGVIFYELLTGQLPFQGGLMSILSQIATKDPPAPRSFHDDIDPTLETLCLQMLAKPVSERPQSMGLVAKQLTDWRQNRDAPVDETAQMTAGPQIETPAAPAETTNPSDGSSNDQETLPPSVVGDSARTERPSTEPSKAPKRNRLFVASIAVGMGALLIAAVFFLVLGKHSVKITVDDPSISLKVDGKGILIEGEETKIRLSAGKHKLLVQHNGLEAETDTFTVRRDGKTAVHVSIVEGRFRIEDGNNVGSRTATRKSSIAQGDVSGGEPKPTELKEASAMLGLRFSHEADEVVFPSLLDTTDALTIELWVQRDVSHLAAHSLLVGFDSYAAVATSANGTLAFHSKTDEAADPTADKNKMHFSKGVSGPVHIAGVRDPVKREIRVYVDGQRAVQKVEKITRAEGCLKFGSNLIQWQPSTGDFDHSFSGWITRVRISNSARYNDPFQPPRSLVADENTVALYLCNEGRGETLNDSSGNKHHGKIKGAKWQRFPTDPLGHVTKDRAHDPTDWSDSLEADMGRRVPDDSKTPEATSERMLIPKGTQSGDGTR